MSASLQRLVVLFPPDLMQAVRVAAKKQLIPISAYVRLCVLQQMTAEEIPTQNTMHNQQPSER